MKLSGKEDRNAFSRIQLVRNFSHVYNELKPERGVIIEFENADSRHRIRLSRCEANVLERNLHDAEEAWKSHENNTPVSEKES